MCRIHAAYDVDVDLENILDLVYTQHIPGNVQNNLSHLTEIVSVEYMKHVNRLDDIINIFGEYSYRVSQTKSSTMTGATFIIRLIT